LRSWWMTPSDGSSRDCSCRTVAFGFPRTRAQRAPSWGCA
jgi:hypothetical protein